MNSKEVVEPQTPNPGTNEIKSEVTEELPLQAEKPLVVEEVETVQDVEENKNIVEIEINQQDYKKLDSEGITKPQNKKRKKCSRSKSQQ